jgi:aspartate aminotransferase
MASTRAKSINTSTACSLQGLVCHGADVPGIDLGLGELDFDTPVHIREAARIAAERGETRYTGPNGSPRLREAIQIKFQRDNGLLCGDDEVVAGCGAKQVIFNALAATVNPGDEVILPAPYWSVYATIIRGVGGKPVVAKAEAKNRFHLPLDGILARLNARTRWIFMNSPNNPTGTMISQDDARKLREGLAKFRRVLVLCDEVCDVFTYSNSHRSLAVMEPGLRGRTITVNSVSKSYAMSGWRLGYGCAPASLVRRMNQVVAQTTSQPSSISQAAAVAALAGQQLCVDEFRKHLQARCSVACSILSTVSGLTLLAPQGGIFLWVGYKRKGYPDDAAFCARLRNCTGVHVLPGSAFGQPGYFRISMSRPEDYIAEAMRRIARFYSQTFLSSPII